MKTKFLSWNTDPLNPLNYQNSKRWAKEGNVYKLVDPDMEKDKQYLPVEFKMVHKEKYKKGYDPEKKVYIAGIANANIEDRVRERLDPRGVEIESYLKNAQLLAHHSYYHPIGQVEELTMEDDGVHFNAWIGDPESGPMTSMQEEIRSLVAQGILKTVSVGFIPKRIRGPIFNEEGDMEEGPVIEQWELLELSVVAVPCNQDSIFQIRDYRSNVKRANLEEDSGRQSFNENQRPHKNTVVSSSDFDNDGKNLNESSESNKGASNVGVKPNKKGEGDESNDNSEDNNEDNFKGEALTLLRSIGDSMKANTEMTEKVYKKLYEDDKPGDDDEEEEEGGKDGGEAADGKSSKRLDALEDSVKTINNNFNELTKSFKLLTEKLFGDND